MTETKLEHTHKQEKYIFFLNSFSHYEIAKIDLETYVCILNA